jgi:hypothetical protein
MPIALIWRSGLSEQTHSRNDDVVVVQQLSFLAAVQAHVLAITVGLVDLDNPFEIVPVKAVGVGSFFLSI